MVTRYLFSIDIYLGETHQGWYLLARQLGNTKWEENRSNASNEPHVVESEEAETTK